jgi:predicted Zn-dependent peptidase
MESFTASDILHFISPDNTYYSMLPMPKSTLTRIRFIVNVGAINEDKDEVKGVAHFLEHMKRKDSKFYTLEQFIQIYDKNNIKSNAGTSYTHTYYYTSSIGNIDKCLDILWAQYDHTIFNQKRFDDEKHVIINEYNRSYSDLVYLKFRKNLFPQISERLQDPVLGTPESINAIKIDDVINFQNKYYKRPHVIICGNFNVKEVIEKYNLKETNFQPNLLQYQCNMSFTQRGSSSAHCEDAPICAYTSLCSGSFSQRGSSSAHYENAPICAYISLCSGSFDEIYGPISLNIHIEDSLDKKKISTTVDIYFRIYNKLSLHPHIIQILSKLLTDTNASILQNKLRSEMCLTYGVSSKSYQQHNSINYYKICFDCDNDKFEKCIYETVIILNQIHNSGFDAERFEIVKTHLKNDLLINNEKFAYTTDTSIIEKYIMNYIQEGIPFRCIKRSIDIIDALSLEDINNLFRKIFTKNNCAVLIRSNSNDIKSPEYKEKIYNLFNTLI